MSRTLTSHLGPSSPPPPLPQTSFPLYSPPPQPAPPVQHGARADVLNGSGRTPLQEAAAAGHPSCAALLASLTRLPPPSADPAAPRPPRTRPRPSSPAAGGLVGALASAR